MKGFQFGQQRTVQVQMKNICGELPKKDRLTKSLRDFVFQTSSSSYLNHLLPPAPNALIVTGRVPHPNLHVVHTHGSGPRLSSWSSIPLRCQLLECSRGEAMLRGKPSETIKFSSTKGPSKLQTHIQS